MDKVTRQCPQTRTFLKRKESRSGIESRSFQPNARCVYSVGGKLNRRSVGNVGAGGGYSIKSFSSSSSFSTQSVVARSPVTCRTVPSHVSRGS